MSLVLPDFQTAKTYPKLPYYIYSELSEVINLPDKLLHTVNIIPIVFASGNYEVTPIYKPFKQGYWSDYWQVEVDGELVFQGSLPSSTMIRQTSTHRYYALTLPTNRLEDDCLYYITSGGNNYIYLADYNSLIHHPNDDFGYLKFYENKSDSNDRKIYYSGIDSVDYTNTTLCTFRRTSASGFPAPYIPFETITINRNMPDLEYVEYWYESGLSLASSMSPCFIELHDKDETDIYKHKYRINQFAIGYVEMLEGQYDARTVEFEKRTDIYQYSISYIMDGSVYVSLTNYNLLSSSVSTDSKILYTPKRTDVKMNFLVNISAKEYKGERYYRG